MNKYLVIFLVSLWRGLQAEEYIIERRDDLQQDQLTIPNITCFASNVSAECHKIGGELFGNSSCTCECYEDKSTLLFSNNTWKCIENTEFHGLSGCSHILDGRSFSQPIITIPRSRYSLYFLPALKSSKCSVVANRGSNLTCSGTWEQLSNSLVTKTFGVWKDTQEQPNKWYLETLEQLDELEGHVIRLNIKCKNLRIDQYCITMKIEGQLRCPLPSTPPTVSTTTVSTTSSTTAQPRPRPLSSLPTTIAKVTSKTPAQIRTTPTTLSTILTESVSSRPGPTFAQGSTASTKETNPSPFTEATRPEATVGHGSTTRTKESKPFHTTTSFSADKNLKKSTGKEKNNSGLIAGAVAGVTGLAIIAIGIIVMMRRRRKRKSTEQRTTDTADNAGYGRGVDNSLRFKVQESPYEDEYSYAYNNAAPFVKTNKPEVLENKANLESEIAVANLVYGQTEGLNQMASPSYNDAPVYNTLEDPVYAMVDKSKKKKPTNSTDAPIYNTLEEPEYAKVYKSPKAKQSVETDDEPLYNVLEGPESDEGLRDEPPTYQVLEGPFSQVAPVYDVLEGPESDEDLVYGSLEEQDPHVYGALDMPGNRGPPEDNRGYDDMVYDSVGDMINDQGDIYQELNQSGQRDSDEYQALSYPGNTMHLNEINQTHSNA